MILDRKGINILVVAITVLAVGLLTWAYLDHWQTRYAQAPAGNSNSGSIQMLPSGQLPPAMPQDIVLASDAKVLNSYTGITPQGKAQSTIVYSSQESSNQIMAAYIQYFEKNGWHLGAVPVSIATGTKLVQFPNNITGSKSSSTLAVAIIESTGGISTHLVSINMTQ